MNTKDIIHPIWSSDTKLWENEPDQAGLQRASLLLNSQPEMALAELQALASLGSVLSMVYLGHSFRNGRGTAVDLQKSEEWYLRASAGGSALAAGILGAYYFDAKRYSLAEEYFQISAQRNYLPAIFRLGTMYLDEVGIDRQPQKARQYLEQAAALGHIVAKRRLGGLLVREGQNISERMRGWKLMLSSFKEMVVVGAKDPESDRLRG
jgi:TPR repeat protein